MNNDTQRQRNQRERLRKRLAEIKPEDGDMIALISVLKGVLDVLDDLVRE
jgi:hypothetical protein